MSNERAWRPVRVAVIDSGANPRHPHVQPIAGGVHILENDSDDDWLDLLGHGTAVAGAIREKAPQAEIFAVKVFDRALVTSGYVLLRALDWCIDHKMDLINLSLGTLNEAYREDFLSRIDKTVAIGSRIVAAYQMNGRPAFPGSLPGVVGVVLDQACPREAFAQTEMNGATVYAASGFPRPIPGVPPERNLSGVSFAVANVTGLLAAAMHLHRVSSSEDKGLVSHCRGTG